MERYIEKLKKAKTIREKVEIIKKALREDIEINPRELLEKSYVTSIPKE